jgi:uncharacterized protein YegL
MVRIIIVMDCSGSMRPLQKDVLGSFNTFIEEQKKEPGEAIVCLTKFNHTVVVKAPVPLAEMKPLTEQDYSPMGLTALNDAIGLSIDKIKEYTEGKNECPHCTNHKNILCIITDGMENASKDYSQSDVKRMIEEVQGKGWEVHFLAANMDAFQAGTSLGVFASHCQSWDATPDGTRASYNAVNAAVKNYRRKL